MFDIPRAIDVRCTRQASYCSLLPLTRRHREINLLYHPYSVYSAKYTPLGLREYIRAIYLV